jgi:hypothetical protein
MNRWIAPLLAAAAAAATLLAQAQSFALPPSFDAVRPGRLVVTAPPAITLDGKPDKLSPGARIRTPDNMLLLSGTVVGKSLPVVYQREAAGMVHDAWVLTEAEYEKLQGLDNGSPEGRKRLAERIGQVFGARGK